MKTVVQATNLLSEEVVRITEEQEKSTNTHQFSILLILDQFLLLSKDDPVPLLKKDLEPYRCAIVNLVNAAVTNFYLFKERLTRTLQIKYGFLLDIDSPPTPLTCSTLSFDDYNQIQMYQKNQTEFRSRLETIYAYLTNLCVIEEEKKKENVEKEEDKEKKQISDCICS